MAPPIAAWATSISVRSHWHPHYHLRLTRRIGFSLRWYSQPLGAIDFQPMKESFNIFIQVLYQLQLI